MALITEVIGATAVWTRARGKHGQCQQSTLGGPDITGASETGRKGKYAEEM